MAKMKKILENIALDDDVRPVDKYSVIEDVSRYGIVGKSLYSENNILELAEQLSKIAESAHSHVLSETDDWFDKVSISRNMKNLQGMVKEFKKTAVESHQLNQRLTSLYEDMGSVLNRYYDIKEHEDEDEYLRDKTQDIDKEIEKQKVAKSAKMVPHYSPDRWMARRESVDSPKKSIKDIKLVELMPFKLYKK
tara:strand:+ start:207 stop:785 length:579 start_codon:yes stop_codon:yes gene_type:complete